MTTRISRIRDGAGIPADAPRAQMDRAHRAHRRLHPGPHGGRERAGRLGRGARAEGLGRRLRPLFRRIAGHHALRGGDLSGARRHRSRPGPTGFAAQRDGYGGEGLPLRQGRGRDGGLRPRRAHIGGAGPRSPRRQAARFGADHPLHRAAGDRRGGRGMPDRGRRGNQDDQDQGRRRSRARRRDRAPHPRGRRAGDRALRRRQLRLPHPL